MTPEQRATQKVIDSIRTLTYNKTYTLGKIEIILGIPRNTLSGMLNGARKMGKWERLLSEFLKALPKQDKTIMIKISEDEPDPEMTLAEKLPPFPEPTLTELVDKGVAITKVSETGLVLTTDPFGKEGQHVIRSATKQTPPPGMTKSEQIRWYRENNQTLL
jgi:hypothetical protein